MDTSHVWKRIENGERTSASEAWTLLRAMLAEARDREADEMASIEEAAVTVASAIDQVDQREIDRETLLFELRSERGRCRQLDRVLVRMLDRGASDPISSLRSALAEVDDIERAVRSFDSAFARRAEVPSPPPPEPHVEQRNRRLALAGCGALVLVPLLLLVFKIASEESQRGNPITIDVLEGAIVQLMNADLEAGRLRTEADWATRCISSSSSWGPPERAMGWPDIYLDPELDSGVVWMPYAEDDGTEFLEVAWNMDLKAKTIVIVEGPNAGAIVAVDEIQGVDENRLGAADYVRLWSGRMKPSPAPRFALIHLPEPRSMRGLRIVLDTSIISGPNSIDTVGLIRE